MENQEKRQFIRTLCGSIRDDLLRLVDGTPADWDGHELRQWIADATAEGAYPTLANDKRSTRYKGYANARRLLHLATPTPRIESIHVKAFTWLDRSAGNTYMSVDIYADGIRLHQCPYELGGTSGSYHLQLAGEWLQRNGVLKGTVHPNGCTESLWRMCEEEGVALYESTTPVRKNQLYRG